MPRRFRVTDLPGRILEDSMPEPNSGCWLWLGTCNDAGYGQISIRNRTSYAHREAWLAFKYGPLAPRAHICHRCDNTGCVNPAHLFSSTPAGNMADKVAKGRHARGEKQGGNKLTELQVIAIRNDPRRAIEIAAAYSVSPDNIWMIKRRKSWAHVD